MSLYLAPFFCFEHDNCLHHTQKNQQRQNHPPEDHPWLHPQSSGPSSMSFLTPFAEQLLLDSFFVAKPLTRSIKVASLKFLSCCLCHHTWLVGFCGSCLSGTCCQLNTGLGGPLSLHSKRGSSSLWVLFKAFMVSKWEPSSEKFLPYMST